DGDNAGAGDGGNAGAGGGDNAGGGDGDNAGGGDGDGDNAGGGDTRPIPAPPTVVIENGDNTVDSDEIADGYVTISGTSDLGSDVTVSWFGKLYSVGTDDTGNYSMDIPVTGLQSGDSQLSVVASNSSGTSEAVTIDVTVSDPGNIPLPPSTPESPDSPDSTQTPNTPDTSTIPLSMEDLLGSDNDLVIVHDGNTVSVGEEPASVDASLGELSCTDASVGADGNCASINLSSILDDAGSIGTL
ncbi:MAG: hypothetical protein WBD51_00105, partial [Burkholderiaceae bacterium]